MSRYLFSHSLDILEKISYSTCLKWVLLTIDMICGLYLSVAAVAPFLMCHLLLFFYITVVYVGLGFDFWLQIFVIFWTAIHVIVMQVSNYGQYTLK